MGRPRKIKSCHLSQGSTVTRVIGYVRVSTNDQADSGAGLEAQRNAITAEVARRGWELVEIIEDAGVSAKNLDRPGIKRALEMLSTGGADLLLAAKLDRLSRSVRDFTEIIHQSSFYGWKLVVLDCNVDTSTPAGEAMTKVMVTFAELERQMIGVRTREALAVKKSQGIVGGRRANLPATVIDQAQQYRAQGMSYAKIADLFNAQGIPTAQGGKAWHPATIQKALDRVTVPA
jgi:DNA invertase Pin-like site-specific DNA recombinase